MSKTWPITGMSRSFVREAALAALRRGHRVAGDPGHRQVGTVDELSEADCRDQIETYLVEVREQAANCVRWRGTPGDPVATRASILEIVDAQDPPLRVLLGGVPLSIATADHDSRLKTWDACQDVVVAAHGGG